MRNPLGTTELAQLTGLSPRQIQRRSDIPGRKPTGGGHYTFAPSPELDEWVRCNTLRSSARGLPGRKSKLDFRPELGFPQTQRRNLRARYFPRSITGGQDPISRLIESVARERHAEALRHLNHIGRTIGADYKSAREQVMKVRNCCEKALAQIAFCESKLNDARLQLGREEMPRWLHDRGVNAQYVRDLRRITRTVARLFASVTTRQGGSDYL